MLKYSLKSNMTPLPLLFPSSASLVATAWILLEGPAARLGVTLPERLLHPKIGWLNFSFVRVLKGSSKERNFSPWFPRLLSALTMLPGLVATKTNLCDVRTNFPEALSRCKLGAPALPTLGVMLQSIVGRVSRNTSSANGNGAPGVSRGGFSAIRAPQQGLLRVESGSVTSGGVEVGEVRCCTCWRWKPFTRQVLCGA